MLTRLPQVLQRIETIRTELERINIQAVSTRRAPDEARDRFHEVLAGVEATQLRPTTSPAASAPGRFDDIVREAAGRWGLSTDLVHAVIRAESDYNPDCTSSAGAMGLMQLMPGTARALGVTDAYDPAQNILGGSRYLREQLDRFGDLSLALAAYNAGPGAVSRHGGIPPYRETQTYVRRVMDYMRTGGVR